MCPHILTYIIVALISFVVLFFNLKSRKDMYYEQDEMDLPFGNDDAKPKKVNKRNILFTIIAAILWPLTLLIVIGIGIQSYGKKYKVRRKEEIVKKKEQQRIEAFKKSIPSDDASVIIECVDVWKKILYLSNDEQYDKLTESLNEISVADGYTLNVSVCKTPQNGEHFIGDDSYLYVAGKDGEQTRDIFKYINVTNSDKGAWQAFVLHVLWHVLPHFWHGGYNYRTFIFNAQDLQNVIDSVNRNEMYPHISTDHSIYDVRPQITKCDNDYFVSYCYWNDWEGLVREVVEIKIVDRKVVETNTLSKKIEYQYDCGILF